MFILLGSWLRLYLVPLYLAVSLHRCADTDGCRHLLSSVTDTLVVSAQHLATVRFWWHVAGLERSARVSKNCSILDYIPAATEDRLLSTVFLLNFIILEHHHFILMLLTYLTCPCNSFIV